MPLDVLEAATKYVSSGFSVIPVMADGTKKPAIPWADYQAKRPDQSDLTNWFGNGTIRGMGIVHGAISGNSEALDFDRIGAYEEFADLCADHGMTEVLRSCVHINTPTGGKHVVYRCSEPVTGNQKLAQVAIPGEADGRSPSQMKHEGYRQIDGAWFKVSTKIETRGEGGYTIAPGSPRSTHATGNAYTRCADYGRFTDLPVLTPEQRNGLLAMARACNEFVEPDAYIKRDSAPGAANREHAEDAFGLRPGEDYNERGNPLELLEAAGWVPIKQRGDGAIELRRPGKKDGMSATFGAVGPNVFYCFTSSASPFELNTAYSPFAVYCLLKCNGDFEEAARQLGKEGYGNQTPPNVARAINVAKAAQDDAGRRTVDYKPFEGLTDEAPPPPHVGDEETPRVAAAFHLTDDGNGLRLAARHGQDLRYCYSQSKWYVWDGRRWKIDEGDMIEMRAKETARELLKSAVTIRDIDEQKAIASHALKMQAHNKISAMIAMARSEMPISADDFDLDNWLLNCQNGTLDLRHGRLSQPRRVDMITKLVPFDYERNATAPRWEQFLEQVMPDEETRVFLQRAVGYALTGDVSEQCLFFLYGSGSNGKSTFLETISEMLGEYAQQAEPELLISKDTTGAANTGVADLKGSRFVATVEIEDGKRMAEGVVKQITGGDKITARRMRQDFFRFKPTHKIFLAANHRPVIKAQDYAIWRRIKVIPFTVQIADEAKDPHLGEKLRAEIPGIFAWVVRGCLDWQKYGLKESEQIKAAISEYREDMDVLKDFMDDCCVKSPSASVPSGVIYKVYCNWCDQFGTRALSLRAFTQRLKEQKDIQYSERLAVSRQRGWLGIGIQTEHDPMNSGLLKESYETEI